jgi:hypothetical protein
LLDTLFSGYKGASKVWDVVGLAGTFMDPEIVPAWVPGKVSAFMNNPAMKFVGRSFSVLGAGTNLVGFVKDPSIQTGVDLGVAGIGVFAAFASGPAALVAGAFAGGYAIGQMIEPHVSEWLWNALE